MLHQVISFIHFNFPQEAYNTHKSFYQIFDIATSSAINNNGYYNYKCNSPESTISTDNPLTTNRGLVLKEKENKLIIYKVKHTIPS